MRDGYFARLAHMRFPMDMEIILRAQHDGNFVGFVTHGDEAV